MAEPAPQIKSYDCGDIGVIDMRTTSFGVDGMPETRLIVYTPAGAADAGKIEQLRVRSQLRRVLQVSAAG